MALFRIENLTFSYPARPEKPTLDGVTLTVERGEYLAICGRSGSGKTTLLRHLKTVLTPFGTRSGSILFDGRALETVPAREQAMRIGYVMQDPDSQLVTDKVWHELAFGLESLGTDPKMMRLRVAEMASYFGIQDWFHRDVSELSGGQKQLLNLASVMAMQPDVLILDEPTSQLDPIAAADFLNTVRKINRELGTTVLITEHRTEDIFHAADRVIVMERGKITADDTPRNVVGRLRKEQSGMLAALPAPVRIFCGVGGSGERCPLTVREGRDWLSRLLDGNPLRKTQRGEAFAPDADRTPALSLHEVWQRYSKDGRDVLKGLSFSVPQGCIYAVVGGNGTGKSTMLRAVCGVCKPYRGAVRIFGRSPSAYRGTLFRGCLALLPQDPQSLFLGKSVREELEEMGADAETVRRTAELCELTELMEANAFDLSGGEQQRTALAKVLLTEPRLLLLDEPTKGLDCFFKQKFAEILGTLRSQGVTVVMVTHDVEFCAAHADLVGMFFDGQLLTANTPRAFFSQNSFYTTAANRMSRHLFPNAVTAENVIELCRENLEL